MPILFIPLIIIIYLKVQSNPWNPEKAPLQRVISNHFMTTTISKSCIVKKFLEQHDLKVKGANVFIECTNPIVDDSRDVMLMDKVIL